MTAQVLFVLNRAEGVSDTLASNSRYKKAREEVLADDSIPRLEFGDDAQTVTGDAYVDLKNGNRVGLESMMFLWYPWCVLVYDCLARDLSLSPQQRDMAQRRLHALLNRYPEVADQIDSGETFVLAEHIFCESHILATIRECEEKALWTRIS